jgi:hypothetical protein
VSSSIAAALWNRTAKQLRTVTQIEGVQTPVLLVHHNSCILLATKLRYLSLCCSLEWKMVTSWTVSSTSWGAAEAAEYRWCALRHAGCLLRFAAAEDHNSGQRKDIDWAAKGTAAGGKGVVGR